MDTVLRLAARPWPQNHAFTQTVLIKLALSQAAHLGIHVLRKISNAAPPRGTCLRTHY